MALGCCKLRPVWLVSLTHAGSSKVLPELCSCPSPCDCGFSYTSLLNSPVIPKNSQQDSPSMHFRLVTSFSLMMYPGILFNPLIRTLSILLWAGILFEFSSCTLVPFSSSVDNPGFLSSLLMSVYDPLLLSSQHILCPNMLEK